MSQDKRKPGITPRPPCAIFRFHILLQYPLMSSGCLSAQNEHLGISHQAPAPHDWYAAYYRFLYEVGPAAHDSAAGLFPVLVK